MMLTDHLNEMQSARQAERERCAKIAEEIGRKYWATYYDADLDYTGGEIRSMVNEIAAAIRHG